jgi:hypothetical protein
MRLYISHKTFTLVVLLLVAVCTQAQLTVQSGETISTTGNAVIALQDIELINKGTIHQTAGNGSFVFTGGCKLIHFGKQ